MTVILDYLNPSIDDFLKMVEDNTLIKRPKKVSNAINIYVHKVLDKWRYYDENPEYRDEANLIKRGKYKKVKQNAFYVRIDKNGKAIDYTKNYTLINTELEIENAIRYGILIKDKENNVKFSEIVGIINSITKNSL